MLSRLSGAKAWLGPCCPRAHSSPDRPCQQWSLMSTNSDGHGYGDVVHALADVGSYSLSAFLEVCGGAVGCSCRLLHTWPAFQALNSLWTSPRQPGLFQHVSSPLHAKLLLWFSICGLNQEPLGAEVQRPCG